MTRIYLVRHGETDWNKARRIQGSTDIPLNEKGREQAAMTGQLLASREWDAIYASPLSRAFETAEIIAAEVGLPAPTPCPEIVERNYGAAEGLVGEEIDARYPGKTPVPGRETREEVAARVVPAIIALAEKHHEQSIIVVSHGGVIRTILTTVAPDHYLGVIRNGSVHSFRHTDGSLDLIAFDDPIEVESLATATEDLEQQNAVEGRDAAIQPR